MAKYRLPIVAEISEGGYHFIVYAVPWGLAVKGAQGGDQQALAAEIYERCVEVEEEEKPSIDDLSVGLVGRIVNAATGGTENPPSPAS